MAMSCDPFDQYIYGEPDDVTVQADWLTCYRCGAINETVTQADGLCEHCYRWNRRHPDVPRMRPRER